MTLSLQHLAMAIERQRVDLSSEKDAQAALMDFFTGDGWSYETPLREHRLTPEDVVDFFFPLSGIALEVKLRRTTTTQTLRQVSRYAEHPDVKSLCVASARAMSLPSKIGDDHKPLVCASLGRAWL